MLATCHDLRSRMGVLSRWARAIVRMHDQTKRLNMLYDHCLNVFTVKKIVQT